MIYWLSYQVNTSQLIKVNEKLNIRFFSQTCFGRPIRTRPLISPENSSAKSLFNCRLRPATLLKNKLWHRCFPVNFEEFLRTLFFTEHNLVTPPGWKYLHFLITKNYSYPPKKCKKVHYFSALTLLPSSYLLVLNQQYGDI